MNKCDLVAVAAARQGSGSLTHVSALVLGRQHLASFEERISTEGDDDPHLLCGTGKATRGCST